MSFHGQLLLTANLWFGASLLVFVIFRFARLRDGRGFRRRRDER
ncbi:hypothetical protein [Cohnella rhizosphaerae]|uniref:Uncharacterized protein n=1 Tax=Cohnella rhizosphaerae TaxID=1457232 RepID=A0A9X4KUM6_9BACL|nr:hypothetical protein [Cohnella rhizosphaerae]MDG0811384.1 hypothetical protein [Cohnella rhizosphaerae]